MPPSLRRLELSHIQHWSSSRYFHQTKNESRNRSSIPPFKEGIPNLYEGDLTVEEEVLDWLTEMKVESHIELITRPMLETMVEETQYLAVFFCE